MRTAWHHFACRASTLPQNNVIQALLNVGLRTVPLSSRQPPGPGVLFFDQIDAELCELIRQASRNGLERVLAVAVSRVGLGYGLWRLLESGASDVFQWEHSGSPAEEIAARLERWKSVDHLVDSDVVRNNLVGRSPAWISVLRQVVEVARFTDAPVLINGDSGTGKELVARLIHTLDARPDKRNLVILDCTTIVPELSGSEFFGHERGAFTGAVATRDGAFALADGGTLFLDEVGDLPPGLQAELLRVVQERTFKRLGDNVWQKTDFRLVCATNRDLHQRESQGQFRRDFYYRIANWTCRLPPLRERPEDILPLADHFLRQLRPRDGQCLMDPEVREYLLQREYPGNVRDLKQVVSRMCYRHAGPGPITAGDIPQEDRPRVDLQPDSWRDDAFERAISRALALGMGLREIKQAAEDTAIQIALDNEKGTGCKSRAAKRLGVTDRTLQIRARRHHTQSGHAGTPPD